MKYILCQLWPQLFQHISCYTPSAHKLSAGPTIFPQYQNVDFTVIKMGRGGKERDRERPNQLLLHILTLLGIYVLHLKFHCA